MSFDVHFTIVGLCNFSAPPNASAMTILMPKDHGGAHYHAARLFYDKAYQSPGGRHYQRKLYAHDLDGAEVDIPAAVADLDLSLPPEVLHVNHKLQWGPMKQDARRAASAVTKAKVRFGCGGISDYLSTYAFAVPGEKDPVRLANIVTWTIRGIQQRAFEFTITTNGAPETVTLHPVRENIRIHINHVPLTQLPMKGRWVFPSNEIDETVDHFDLYKPMYSTVNQWQPKEDRTYPAVEWEDAKAVSLPPEQKEARSTLTYVPRCFTIAGE